MATLVTLTDVKRHVRRPDTAEDGILQTYLDAAIRYVENYTGHVLSPREVTDTFSQWGDYLTLRHQPITVDDPTPTLTVTYGDLEGDETEYAARVIRDQRYPWTITPPYGETFPALGDNGTIAVEYTAGYAAGEVPPPLNQAVLLLCGQWYANRSASSPDSATEIPFAVSSLCRPYRGAVMA